MSEYYRDKIESAVYGSRLLLYKRSDTPNDTWWFRAKVEGHKGYVRRSCRTSNAEIALTYANQKFDELRYKKSNNQSLKELTFEQYFTAYMKRGIERELWTDSRTRYKQGTFERYLNPYMGSKKLADLTQRFVEDYWQWRLAYWNTGEGKERITYNPKRGKNPKAKTQSTHNAAKRPAYNTLRAEASLVNEVLKAAIADGFMTLPIKISPHTAMTREQQREEGWARRDTFTEHEYNTLTTHLYNYAENRGAYKSENAHALHMIQRRMLHAYILFLSSTGLRVGEARQLTWGDLRWDKKTSDGDAVLVVRVRAETTKVNKEREAVSHNSHIISIMQKYQNDSAYKDDENLIFYSAARSNEGCFQVDMSANFKAFLKSVPYKDRKDGLLKGEKEKNRTLYALRHLYATFRLKKGVDYMALSTVMGTSPTQLRNHYSHVSGSDIIDAVTLGSPLNEKTNQKQAVQTITNMMRSGIWDEEKVIEELKRLRE
jgi:integrase